MKTWRGSWDFYHEDSTHQAAPSGHLKEGRDESVKMGCMTELELFPGNAGETDSTDNLDGLHAFERTQTYTIRSFEPYDLDAAEYDDPHFSCRQFAYTWYGGEKDDQGLPKDMGLNANSHIHALKFRRMQVPRVGGSVNASRQSQDA